MKVTARQLERWADKPIKSLREWEELTDLFEWQDEAWYNRALRMSVTVHHGSILSGPRSYWMVLQPGRRSVREFLQPTAGGFEKKFSSKSRAQKEADTVMGNPIAYILDETGVSTNKLLAYLNSLP